MTFDGDDYRKRVLAVVQRRGGVPASDPFEWYDLPLTDVRDSTAQQQVDAVWAFWQKQRDSPKYRGLVTALLAEHRSVAPLMLSADSRRALAEQVRRARKTRQDDRGAALDAAAQRLVDRFGGVPRSKLAGLRALGLSSGLGDGEVEARLDAYGVLDVQSTPAAVVPPAVVRQLRADLDELGRLLGSPPPATLYDLLGLPPGAEPSLVVVERESAAARNRQLRPDRQRALVDDLLAAVTALLVEGDGEAYLDAVAGEVADRLRPRLAAAVLVEDVLTPSDAAVLRDEAVRAGLDAGRAEAVVARLAVEAGVPPPASLRPAAPRPAHIPGAPGGPGTRPDAPGPAGPAHDPGAGPVRPDLLEARAALDAGHLAVAERLVAEALRRDAAPPARALAAEVEAALADARQRWRAAEAALAARRWHEAHAVLAVLAGTAQDLPSPSGRTLADAQARAAAGLAAAAAAVAAGDEAGLLRAAADAPDAPVVLDALRRLGVLPPSAVRAARSGASVVVSWTASPSPGAVEYRVVRVAADGSRSPVGTTTATSLEDGGVRPGADLPGYAVQARRAGVVSDEATTTDRHAGASSGARGSTAGSGSTTSASSAPAATAPAVPTPLRSPLGTRGDDRGIADLAPVAWLSASLVRRGLGLSFPPPVHGRVEVRRVPAGVRLPEPGTPVDPDALGPLVPRVGPGLAVDVRPGPDGCAYVAVVLGPDGAGVAGASVAVAQRPPVTGLRAEQGRLRWDWPDGCTEALVLVRVDGPPSGPGDPDAAARKTTNTRYALDDGVSLPDGPVHVSVHACARAGPMLLVGTEPARLELPG